VRSRKLRAACLLLLFSTLLLPLLVAAHQQIFNARIISGTGQLIDQGWIEIHQGRITGIGSGQPTRLSADRINANGLTLMPGFIDTHRHLFAYANLRSDRALHRYMRQELPEILLGLLRAGFTTILSPGDHVPEIYLVRARLADGTLVGPRLLTTGQMLHAPGDHPATTLCRGNRYCKRKLAASVSSDTQARARVRKLVSEGVDMIKVVHDRELRPRTVIADSLIKAIADESMLLRVPVVLHTREAHDLVRLARLGIRRVVHTPLIGSLAQAGAGSELRSLGVVVQSTLSWTSQEIAVAQRRKPTVDDQARLQQGQANVRYLSDSGVPLAFATDNPPPLGATSFMPEVRALGAVLSNSEIIQTMTHNAAVFLQRDHEIGAIAPGMVADLVLVDGNPLTDITALTRVRRVWQRGVAVQLPPPQIAP
jgi:imidazolonepropionase-like amidohydrolase